MHTKKSHIKIEERLKISTFKLESLLDITKAINNNESRDKIFVLYANILKKQLKIGKALLLHNNGNKWIEAVKFGTRIKDFKFNIQHLLSFYDITPVSSNSLFYPFDIVVPVFHKNLPLAYVLLADVDEEQITISPTIKHLPFIQTLTNIVAVAIENKRLAKEHSKKQLLDRELQLAREVQQTLFPQTLNLHSNFQLAVRYVPHHQIGGDYYDFFKIDNQNYGIVIGDVSGKGISAALLLANFQANLRLLFENKFSLSEIVKQLNKKVIQASGGNRFITIFIGIYNTETQQLKYINAGHVPPFLFTKGKFVYLREGTTGLGMVDEIPFIIEGDIRITYGDILCMFTDGLTELKLPDGNYISELQIEQFIKQNYMQPVQILEKNLYRFIKRSTLNQSLSDDLTFVICKFTP